MTNYSRKQAQAAREEYLKEIPTRSHHKVYVLPVKWGENK